MIADMTIGVTVAIIAVLLVVVILAGMAMNYRHERHVIANRKQDRALDREHELLKLDAQRQNLQLEVDAGITSSRYREDQD
jgi:hypothetical protein